MFQSVHLVLNCSGSNPVKLKTESNSKPAQRHTDCCFDLRFARRSFGFCAMATIPHIILLSRPVCDIHRSAGKLDLRYVLSNVERVQPRFIPDKHQATCTSLDGQGVLGRNITEHAAFIMNQLVPINLSEKMPTKFKRFIKQRHRIN